MTWTPKPGDRVTSPLLVGEWEVGRVSDPPAVVEVWQPRLNHVDARSVQIRPSYLTPVAPPLPPEPPVGSVVRAHGRLWQQRVSGIWYSDVATSTAGQEWRHLATAPDLSPVVAVEDVAEWLDNYRLPLPSRELIRDFRDEFGWWGK